MGKKIALFSYTLLSGGAEKQLVLLANTYSKIHKVTIFVYFHDKIDKRIVKLIDNNENLSVVKLNGSIIYKLYFLYKELKKRNIEYFFSYLTFPNLIGSIVAKYAAVPFVFSGIRTASLPKKKWILESFINRYLADFTIFNNYTGEKNSKYFGLREDKNIVISNCLDKKIESNLIRKNNSIPVVITVGRFVEEKDYNTALKSIKILVDKGLQFKYIIIGYGKLELEIRKLIKVLALQNVVEIIIKPSTVYPYLLKSDIYLSTSLFEGTSNSILEAMNSDLPIVATNVGDNNYLIEEGYNGYLLNKKDINGIFEKLETLLINKTLRELLGKNNKDVIKRKFSFQIFEKKYFELLNLKKSK